MRGNATLTCLACPTRMDDSGHCCNRNSMRSGNTPSFLVQCTHTVNGVSISQRRVKKALGPFTLSHGHLAKSNIYGHEIARSGALRSNSQHRAYSFILLRTSSGDTFVTIVPAHSSTKNPILDHTQSPHHLHHLHQLSLCDYHRLVMGIVDAFFRIHQWSSLLSLSSSPVSFILCSRLLSS